MKVRLSTVCKAIALALLLVINTGFLPTAAAHADPNGNNGTLKVHEYGTPSGTESNDPQVCAFNFEGFSFDTNQSGYIDIDVQGGSSPVGISTGPFSFGPTDNNGYAATEYFNAAGGPTVVDGTYKATLYGKDANGNIDLTDVKAKSKVFKVDCEGINTVVTPADVTFTDTCGTANDTYTIPSTSGVLYQIAGSTVTAGTYAGSGTVTVDAVALANYALAGTTSWSYTFSDIPCAVTVTPAPVVFTDVCGTANDTYTIPSTSGVLYQIAGSTVTAGTYAGSGTVTVDAVALANYALAGTTSWSYTFTDVACSPEEVTATAPTFVDLTCDTLGSYTIPSVAGVIYKVNGNQTAAGIYQVSLPLTINITAEATDGLTLSGQSSWSHTYALAIGCSQPPLDICPNIQGTQSQAPNGYTVDSSGDCVVISTTNNGGGGGHVLGASTVVGSVQPELVNTGDGALVNILVGLTLITSATGVALYNRRSQAANSH